MSNTLRITGLASGLDVDNLVKTMMKAENTRLDKVKQDKQYVQWRQDAYRDIINDVVSFKNTYLDLLSPADTNMLSGNNYATYDIALSDGGTTTTSSILSAAAGVGATAGTYSVKVDKLAKAAVAQGTSFNQVKVIDLNNWVDPILKKISFSVNGGTAETIEIGKNYVGSIDDINKLAEAINKEIELNSNLKGKISVTAADLGVNEKYLKFNVLTNDLVKIDPANTTINSEMDALKGKLINANTSTKLSEFGVGVTSNFKFTYSGGTTEASISVGPDMTIDDFINEINNKTSGNVNAKFSQLTGKLTLESIKTGSSANINITAGIGALGLNNGSYSGEDAIVRITPPGGVETTVVKASNSFTIDGVTYNLLKESSTSVNMNLTSNPQKAFDKIKTFIDKYNEIIDKIGDKLDEKKQYSYKPLTDEQKKEMKDEEIKSWEDNAKKGILKNDSQLQNMLYSLRNAFFDSVEGAGVTLSEIGLSTSDDYTQKGKIVLTKDIDGQYKLFNALKTKGKQVADIFIKPSDKDYDPDGKNSTERYAEEGIFQRINDLLKDNTRTTRNTAGYKGLLIEKAGIKGDLSEIKNTLSTSLKDYDKKISDLTYKLSKKEEYYYSQFSKLETAMSKLNSQSNWLSSQLGTGSGQ